MELSKYYEPRTVEEKWRKIWDEQNIFHAAPNKEKEAFSVVIPPPNITGVLHLGHCLNLTVQDILCRRARQEGKNVCWVPGIDHASIATEAKVWEALKKEGLNKDNLTRADFLKYAKTWKEKYGGTIYKQLKQLGLSLDWSRATFTMDEEYSRAVQEVFIRLYEGGFIYKAEKIVHWDVAAKTVISDEEVIYKEVASTLYYLKYYIEGSENEYVTVATQRPETIMGDVAVCANPTDTRYQHLKGKKVIIPLIGKSVPVIFDAYVTKDFGTGLLKITPAHDVNDYKIGKRHNLSVVDILTDDGKISAVSSILQGVERFEARKQIVKLLTERELIVIAEQYTTSVGFSQRTEVVVEPKVSTQWFVKMKELAQKALTPVLEEHICIYPKGRFISSYKHWLENVQDWCISRQLWWGHRIPVYYNSEKRFVAAHSVEEAVQKFKKQLNITEQSETLVQEEDCLDTWFSSWLWSMEAFKGITIPENPDFKYFCPVSVLVTGQDILFFWVARMIMAGMHFKKEIPFKNVYFTGMVRDKEGRKMSKSLGNSPDLSCLIDTDGADALRFAVMIATSAGNDLLFDEKLIEQGRNFNNKLWNILKLLDLWNQTKIKKDKETPEINTYAYEWIYREFLILKMNCKELYEKFKLSEILKKIYIFLWEDFSSFYLEMIKPRKEVFMDEKTLVCSKEIFGGLLALLNPFMPFITEEIHSLLFKGSTSLVYHINENIPELPADSVTHCYPYYLIQVIKKIREIKASAQIRNTAVITLRLDMGEEEQGKDMVRFFIKYREIISGQTNLDVRFNNDTDVNLDQASYFFLLNAGQKVWIFVPDKGEDVSKMQEEYTRLTLFLQKIKAKLINPKFKTNVPADVYAKEVDKQRDVEARINILKQKLNV